MPIFRRILDAEKVTDAEGNVVWTGEALGFGSTKAEGAVRLDFRFPGQVEDRTTGYFYNYFRDYDASVGRYLQSDPIGLRGGVNTFGYVSGNSILYVDYLGTDRRLENTAAVFGMHQRVAVDTWEKTPGWHPPMSPDGMYTKTGFYGISFGMTSRDVPQQGFFEAMGEAPAFGKEGSRMVYVDNDPATVVQASISTTPEQDILTKQQFEGEVGKTGPYNALSNNCRTYSSSIFGGSK